jgi:hypothetical protein
MEHDVLTFDGDDSTYLRWLHAHLDGFVVNTNRRPSPQYMVLHPTRR